jgi:hypothetical protein
MTGRREFFYSIKKEGEVQQNPSDPVISDSYHGLGMI